MWRLTRLWCGALCALVILGCGSDEPDAPPTPSAAALAAREEAFQERVVWASGERPPLASAEADWQRALRRWEANDFGPETMALLAKARDGWRAAIQRDKERATAAKAAAEKLAGELERVDAARIRFQKAMDSWEASKEKHARPAYAYLKSLAREPDAEEMNRLYLSAQAALQKGEHQRATKEAARALELANALLAKSESAGAAGRCALERLAAVKQRTGTPSVPVLEMKWKEAEQHLGKARFEQATRAYRSVASGYESTRQAAGAEQARESRKRNAQGWIAALDRVHSDAKALRFLEQHGDVPEWAAAEALAGKAREVAARGDESAEQKIAEASKALKAAAVEGARRKRAHLSKLGKTSPTSPGAFEETILEGLGWLARHQDDDGRWDADGFGKHDGVPSAASRRLDGNGNPMFDVGVTGLALMAFLDAGFDEKTGAYAPHVWNALLYLVRTQADDGVFGTRATRFFIYNHAIATIAMAQAYARSKNPAWKRPLELACDFLLKARNPDAGWRYTPRGGTNDMSITSWCYWALYEAHAAGVKFDIEPVRKSVDSYLGKMTDPNFGVVGYDTTNGPSSRPDGMHDRFPPEYTAAMSAAGLHLHYLLGNKGNRKKLSMTLRTQKHVMEVDSDSEKGYDQYYWFWKAKAGRRMAKIILHRWKPEIHGRLAPVAHGRYRGSYAPVGVWGQDGGRVYSTALGTLTWLAFR